VRQLLALIAAGSEHERVAALLDPREEVLNER
jgi:hypothetical protein